MEEKIIETLESWGCTDIEVIGESVWFQNDNYESEIKIEDLDLDDRGSLKNSTMYSCCGTPLDPDYMICSKCGEHC